MKKERAINIGLAGILFVFIWAYFNDSSGSKTSNSEQEVQTSNDEEATQQSVTVQPSIRGAQIQLEVEERDFGTIWDHE